MEDQRERGKGVRGELGGSEGLLDHLEKVVDQGGGASPGDGPELKAFESRKTDELRESD